MSQESWQEVQTNNNNNNNKAQRKTKKHVQFDNDEI